MDEEMMFEMSAGSLEGLPSVGEMFDLTGKVAVVSGTIGLALSVIYRLASCGAKVVFGARREVIGQMAEERLREMGLDVRFHKLDVSSVESCREIVAFAEQTYGTVDIVVPVAAAFFARAFVDIKESEYDRIVDVDQKGQYFLVQAAARSMIRGKKGGKVVTVASVAYRGEDMPKLAMMTAYNTAKAGVVGMTRGIAKELKQYGINVNCVAPGVIDTDMLSMAPPEARAMLAPLASTDSTSDHCWSVTSWRSIPGRLMPALHTSTSRWPNRSKTVSAMALTWAGSDTSPQTGNAPFPISSQRAKAASLD